jgi:hypothetical protein
MRWAGLSLVPINGWQPRSADLSLDGDEAVRSGTLVTNEGAGANLFLGSNKKIYMVSPTNVVTDVTPTGFTVQLKDAAASRGYGLYQYSYGQYGTPRHLAAAASPLVPIVFSWGFSEWGFWPVAVARQVGGLRVFIKTDSDTDFVSIATSPQGAHDVLVTDERFLMTFGNNLDYRLVEWSDRENYAVWAPLITNQAGSYRLAGTGKLLRGVKVASGVLVLGENDAFIGRYVGPPYVYGFERAGDHCGVVGPEAVASTEGFAMWMGDTNFWRYDGSVTEIYCEVMDYYQKDHNRRQRSKTKAFTISDYAEIWWLYQSNSSPTGDIDSYLIYNWRLKSWYYGRIDRTWGIDNDPLAYPLMVSTTGRLYDHEVVSAGRDNRVPYITSGPLEFDGGAKNVMGIAYVFPDVSSDQDVEMVLDVRDSVQDKNPRYSRTFDLRNAVSTHGIMGRDIRMTLRGKLVNPNWVLGDFRVEPTSDSF